ncbi:alpha/beta hydrolase [Glycomyces algeriensis]|uniref:DUF1023 domain-containing protein n=1 Tax=Glycomyces algeriensis TaxID=256037 RepID=A0A9W6G4X8_9ACTN|nr:alpha/beta hydrolase [Glycomyces algeriensis]MDA1367180.1 alpha/beta hydrolase [Glycomyces algeriensis]MDR7353436.1 hypothetical protein [Glycomyces algeriensis]GLI41134.1 hypothetical protein GALLR39Z86_09840 [Glycomyces algeriensis]
MSEMSWKDLRDLDCGAIQTIGVHWSGYVPKMTEQTERLRNDVIAGHLSTENFESETADLVRDQIDLFTGRFEDDLNDYAHVRVSTALLEAAEALKAEQDELLEVTGLIEDRWYEIEGDKSNYEVNPSGKLHRSIYLHLDPPQWLCERVGIEKPSAWYDLLSESEVMVNLDKFHESAKELGEQYQDWLRSIMSRAHDADDDAAAALAAMRENPPELPPELGATYDDLIDDYKTELSEEIAAEMEAIANGESGMSPEQVNRWWEGLSDAEQEALVSEHPEWVGPTDGIPTDVRDTANRTALDNEIEGMDDRIAAIESQMAHMEAYGSGDGAYGGKSYTELQAELVELREDRGLLGDLRNQVTDDGKPAIYGETGQPYYLLGFDSEGEGQAIVSIGNPDTAAYVNAYVPGTGANLGEVDGGLMNRTETMAYDAYRKDPEHQTATVLWMGYDAPDNAMPFQNGAGLDVEAMHSSQAEDAAEDLSSFTQGIRATAENEPAELTLTGHSYGTTVIGTAAATEGVDADNLILVASPGTSVDTADALGVGAENVWATTNSEDMIQYTAVHGTDPTSEAFGANVFYSEPVGWNPISNHSVYWGDANEEEGRSTMGLIVTGQKG